MSGNLLQIAREELNKETMLKKIEAVKKLLIRKDNLEESIEQQTKELESVNRQLAAYDK